MCMCVLFVFIYICTSVFYVCAYMYVCIYVYVCMCTYECMYFSTSVRTYAHLLCQSQYDNYVIITC